MSDSSDAPPASAGPRRRHRPATPRTLSRWQRVQAEAIALVGTPMLEGLGGTYDWRDEGLEHLDEIARQGRQPIIALWHGRILAGTLYLRDRGLVVIISASFDGEWIARLVRRFGFSAVRGSTSRGGAKALVQLRREMREGRPTAFTVDGPRGPAKVVQPGAIWLAGATGNPVVPFHIESSSYWTLTSWDRHQAPRPGARVAAIFGAPIEIGPNADAAAIERGQQELAGALARLETRALVMLQRR